MRVIREKSPLPCVSHVREMWVPPLGGPTNLTHASHGGFRRVFPAEGSRRGDVLPAPVSHCGLTFAGHARGFHAHRASNLKEKHCDD